MDGRVRYAIALLLLTECALAPHGRAANRFPDSLVVGWSDEFNNPADWKSFPVPNAPDMSAPRKGVLRLTIGKRAVDGSIPFNWASAWRIAEVDLKRYPILAVSTHDLRGPGWWDITVQRWEKGRLVGQEVKSPSLDHASVLLFDLTAAPAKALGLADASETNPQPGPISLRIRINIAGTRKGCSVDYYWMRFIRREDAERVRKHPRINDLVVEP